MKKSLLIKQESNIFIWKNDHEIKEYTIDIEIQNFYVYDLIPSSIQTH
jgi:CRISPR/Cas system CMR-associated protein Cmr1 (group 7 of RAMP superfamily)